LILWYGSHEAVAVDVRCDEYQVVKLGVRRQNMSASVLRQRECYPGTHTMGDNIDIAVTVAGAQIIYRCDDRGGAGRKTLLVPTIGDELATCGPAEQEQPVPVAGSVSEPRSIATGTLNADVVAVHVHDDALLRAPGKGVDDLCYRS
jgi:hypothetical protein